MRLVPTALFIVLIASTPSTFAQTSLFAQPLLRLTAPLPGGPVAFAGPGFLEDVDGDGDADLVRLVDGHIVVWTAAGGTFGIPAQVYPTVANAFRLARADVDVDGDVDVLLTTSGVTSPDLLVVHLNDGTGGFAAMVQQAIPTQFIEMVIGRFDAGTAPDLVLRNGSQRVVLLGNGDGTFQAPLPGPTHSGILFPGDSDGDGDDDLNFVSANSLDAYPAQSGGAFGAAATVVAGTAPAFRVLFLDADGDADEDVLLLAATGQATQLQLLRRDPAGALVPETPQVVSLRSLPFGPDFPDVNGDGAPDFLGASTGSGTAALGWSLNDGAGSFGVGDTVEISGVASVLSVSGGDVTGDGHDDVVTLLGEGIVLHDSLGAAGLRRPVTVDVPDVNPDSPLAIGDLDFDGRLDAVLAGDGGSPGAYTFVFAFAEAPMVVNVPTLVEVTDLTLADFDHDGVLDLASVVTGAARGFVLQMGDGAGGFATPTFHPTPSPPIQVLAADVNGDGDLDAVVRDEDVSVLLGDGAGSFGAPSVVSVCGTPCFPTFSSGGKIALGDVDRDGILDLAVAQGAVVFTPPTVDIHLGDGMGGFGAGTSLTMTGVPNAPILADVNGDGFLDVLTSGTGVNVALGNGTASPAAPVNFPFPSVTVQGLGGRVAVGDVDGNGTPDVLLSGGGVLLNDGLGAFTPQLRYVGEPAVQARLVDVDDDLQLDAVFLNAVDDRLVWSRNRTPCGGEGAPYGLGCPGSGGFVPALDAAGCPSPGGAVILSATDVLGGTGGWLLAGTSPTSQTLAPGCRLYVDLADAILLPFSVTGPSVPGAGTASLTVPIPASAPGGAVFAVQGVFADAASSLAVAATNGFRFVIQ